MARTKLHRFKENMVLPNLFQPEYQELKEGFFLKGRWMDLYFKNNNPLVLELGCGKGEYTVGMAEKNLQKNFIGLDIKGSRMWVGCKSAIEKSLTNVAFVRRHISGIEHLFERNEVDEIWITFPDPHLRERQSKRRLTSPEFVARYSKILKPGGKIHLKTDDTTLYDYTLQVCQEYGFEIEVHSSDVYGENIQGFVTQLQTYYETMWLEQGLKIKYVCFIPFPAEKGSFSEQSFFERVWAVARKIPVGRVTSYGAIAKFLGSTGSARMVGWAMNACKEVMPPVPAHRVVNRNGMLTGKFHFGGIEAMQQLLKSEGIEVVDDQIMNFEEIFWQPN